MIIHDYSEQIEQFMQYLQDKLSSIDAVDVNSHNKVDRHNSLLFKKILYVSFLDSLSSCVYPGRSNNRERFVSMLERFSQWEDRDRISLPHLARFVHLSSDPLLENARQYVTPIIKKWIQRSIGDVLITEDPKFDDSLRNEISWKRDDKSGIKLSVDYFKHSNLLYQLRNALVHQFQSRGDEMGSFVPDGPFYKIVHEQVFKNSKPLGIKPLRIEL